MDSPISTAVSPRLAAHARTASDIELANLSLDDEMNPFSSGASRLSDDDLLNSLPDLGQGVLEEAEESFKDLAHAALVFAASPDPSSRLPSPAPRPRQPTPSADIYADPSYFALSRRNLYADGGDSSWSSAASTTFPASSTPSLCEDNCSDFTSSIQSTPAHSPLPSDGEYFTTAYTASSPNLSPHPPISAGPSSLASRRSKVSPSALRLDLASPTSSSTHHTLRTAKSFSFAPRPTGSSAFSPVADDISSLSPPRTRKPRWMREFEDTAGLSSLSAAAAVEEINFSRRRSRERSAKTGEPGSPVMLKQRKASYGFAF
ncbi:hypothetical protein JCM11641_007750 [Rhodosporidiobolus odoratus]